jgi:hypothetical protein
LASPPLFSCAITDDAKLIAMDKISAPDVFALALMKPPP